MARSRWRLWLPVIAALLLDCTNERAAVPPSAPTPAPHEPPEPPPAHREPGRLFGEVPALPLPLADVKLGLGSQAFRKRYPELSSEVGLHLPEHGVIATTIRDNPSGVVSGIEMLFESAEALEEAVGRWPAPLIGMWSGRNTRVWLNPELGVRVVAINPVLSPNAGDCVTAETSRDHHGNGQVLLIEQYTSVASLLPAGTRLWGFEGKQPILGLSRAALQKRFGARVTKREGISSSYLLLPPIELEDRPLYVTLDFAGEQLGHYRFHAFTGLDANEALRAAARDKVLSNWAPHHRFKSSPWNAYGDEEAWVEWEENSPLQFSVRNSAVCPGEHVSENIAENSLSVERWIAARQPEINATSEYRALRPYMVVSERRRTLSACTIRLWWVNRIKNECEPERLESELLGEDCCDESCFVRAPAALRRMWLAAVTRDVDTLRKLVWDAGIAWAVDYGADVESGLVLPSQLNDREMERIAELYGPSAECELPHQGTTNQRMECRSNLHTLTLALGPKGWQLAGYSLDAH